MIKGSGSNSADPSWTGYRQLLCTNRLPLAIAIREDICEQSLALAMLGRLDHGTIHNSCLTVNPYMQIREMLLRTPATPRNAREEIEGVGPL